MIFPGQITALEARDVKRYPVDVASIPNRGMAAAETDQGLSFPEVAAKIADEQARDLEANPQTTPTKPATHFALWEQEEFGFRDLVDIINPLQHIPIVATLYRHMTGEKIGAVPRVIGGALWGRIGGFVSGLVNAFVDWFTGKDIGDHIYSALFGDPSDSAKETVVAQAPERSLSAPVAPPAAPAVAAVPMQTSPEPVLETDHFKGPVQSLNPKEPLPLSAVPPKLIPDVMSQALLSSYLRGRRHEDSDEDSPRLYVRV
jgi:hypothetical protein